MNGPHRSSAQLPVGVPSAPPEAVPPEANRPAEADGWEWTVETDADSLPAQEWEIALPELEPCAAMGTPGCRAQAAPDELDDDDFDDEFDDDFEDELDEELERELAEKFADDGVEETEEETEEEIIDDVDEGDEADEDGLELEDVGFEDEED
jgi:hypothetical protein